MIKNVTMGPKVASLFNKSKDHEIEDIPDEPESPCQIYIKKQVRYQLPTVPRLDMKGRPIQKGSGYGITFDNFITVCVYDVSEDVYSIKDTVSQATQGQEQQFKINPRLDQKYKGGDHEIILQSILKKQKQ